MSWGWLTKLRPSWNTRWYRTEMQDLAYIYTRAIPWPRGYATGIYIDRVAHYPAPPPLQTQQATSTTQDSVRIGPILRRRYGYKSSRRYHSYNPETSNAHGIPSHPCNVLCGIHLAAYSRSEAPRADFRIQYGPVDHISCRNQAMSDPIVRIWDSIDLRQIKSQDPNKSLAQERRKLVSGKHFFHSSFHTSQWNPTSWLAHSIINECQTHAQQLSKTRDHEDCHCDCSFNARPGSDCILGHKGCEWPPKIQPRFVFPV